MPLHIIAANSLPLQCSQCRDLCRRTRHCCMSCSSCSKRMISSSAPTYISLWNGVKLNFPLLLHSYPIGVNAQVHSQLSKLLPGHLQLAAILRCTWVLIDLRGPQGCASHYFVIPHLLDPLLKGMPDSCHMLRRAVPAVCSQLALLQHKNSSHSCSQSKCFKLQTDRQIWALLEGDVPSLEESEVLIFQHV